MDSPTSSAFGTVAVRVVVLAYVKVTSPLIEHCIRLLYQRLPSNVDHLKVSILGCCQPPVTICQLDLWSHKASPVPALRVHGVRCLDAWETLVTSSSARARTNTHTHTHEVMDGSGRTTKTPTVHCLHLHFVHHHQPPQAAEAPPTQHTHTHTHSATAILQYSHYNYHAPLHSHSDHPDHNFETATTITTRTCTTCTTTTSTTNSFVWTRLPGMQESRTSLRPILARPTFLKNCLVSL
jgi:hypothetical protein